MESGTVKGKNSRFATVIAIGTLASVSNAPALSILSGCDYLSTVGTTYIDLSLVGNPLGLGTVAFAGQPSGPGVADTIIERSEGAELVDVGDMDTVAIELIGLSLVSAAPVDIDGSPYDVYLGLDHSRPSRGQMEISLGDSGLPSGTFTTFIDVFIELALVDRSTRATLEAITGLPPLQLSGGGEWSSTPPPNALITVGPLGDRTVNTHRPSVPGFFDFYVDSLVIEDGLGRGAFHGAKTSIIPEPGTITLLSLGALGMGLRRRKQLR